MPLSCEKARELLHREIRDAELSAEEFAEFDAHRESCRACGDARVREDPLSMFAVLREGRPDPTLWPGLWEGIRAEIEEDAPAFGFPGFLRPAYLVAAAATLVVAVGLAALIGVREMPGSDDAFPGIVDGGVAPSIATVESIGSTSARIYDMQVIDEENRVTELVMIFDEGIDL